MGMMRWSLRAPAAAAAVALLSGACSGLGPELEQAAPGSPATTVVTAEPGPGSPARPRVAAPDPGRSRYVRDEWQPRGWADADGDSCNTREEVLIAESTAPVQLGPGCKVLAGEWDDRYTGRRVTSPTALEIDHLVSLSDAHASGGWAWPAERKVAFTNDLEDADELNATWGPENQRKADYGPDRWLPPNSAFRCAYVAAYARIKARWELTMSPAQWAAVERVWSDCEGSP